ncbi:MAG: HAD family hydrolase [Eubacterium sp.]
MIRFIVSDIDGTLLLNGARHISDEALDIIKQLSDKGILFAVATGRQYDCLRRMFEPVKDEILYICENGAYIVYKEHVISKTPLNRRIGLDICNDIYENTDCEVLLTGSEGSYLKAKTLEFVNHIREDVGNTVFEIDDFRKCKEDILKIAAYNCNGVNEKDRNYLKNKWGKKTTIAISGENWFDINELMVNKGNALAVIQSVFGISEEDTMTFGDNNNDLEMFKHSYFSYAMQSASSQIRNKAKFIAPTVETIMLDVLRMQ